MSTLSAKGRRFPRTSLLLVYIAAATQALPGEVVEQIIKTGAELWS